METSEIITIITAVGAVLVTLGAGIKWIVSTFIVGLKENTKAVTDSSTVMTKAITDASAEQVRATNSLRLELREQRVEIRTLIGMQPPPDTEPSEDGEPAPLTPIRGVPAGLPHMIINRKGK